MFLNFLQDIFLLTFAFTSFTDSGRETVRPHFDFFAEFNIKELNQTVPLQILIAEFENSLYHMKSI